MFPAELLANHGDEYPRRPVSGRGPRGLCSPSSGMIQLGVTELRDGQLWAEWHLRVMSDLHRDCRSRAGSAVSTQ